MKSLWDSSESDPIDCNWRNDPLQHRGYMDCVVKVAGLAGAGAGAITDPAGTISTTIGTEAGKCCSE